MWVTGTLIQVLVSVGSADLEMLPSFGWEADEHALHGAVVGPDGTARALEASVLLYDRWGRLVAAAKTNPDGRYILRGVPAGRYLLVAQVPEPTADGLVGPDEGSGTSLSGGLIAAALVEVGPSSLRPDLHLRLDYGGVIVGRVTQEDGVTPIPDGAVNAYRPDGTWVAQTNTWDDGVYFLVVPASEYVLEARGPAGSPYWAVTYDGLPGGIRDGRNLCNATHVWVPPSEIVLGKDFRLPPEPYGIRVTYPNGGETWVAGESGYVTWTAAGLPGDLPVLVAIRKGANGPGALLAEQPIVADGGTAFDVPMWLGDDVDYVVELRVLADLWAFDFLTTDQSDAPFTIVGSSSASGLALTAPDETTRWPADTEQTITWTAQNVGVTITLLEESRELAFVGWGEGEGFSWNIPANIGNGTTYSIFLSGWFSSGLGEDDSDWGPFDSSPMFEIYGSDPRPTVAITTPNGGEQWQAGARQDICWRSSEQMDSFTLAITKDGFKQLEFGFAPPPSGLEGCRNYTVCPFLPDGDDYRVEGMFITGRRVEHNWVTDDGFYIRDHSDAEFAIVDSQAVIAGDFDRDGDVDGADAGTLVGCITGPGTPLSEPCQTVDVDADGDADLMEFAVLQRCFGCPGLRPDPACAGLVPNISGTWMLYRTPGGQTDANAYCAYIDPGWGAGEAYYSDWDKDYSVSVDATSMGGGVCLSGQGQLYGRDVFYDASATVDMKGMAGTYRYHGAEEESGAWTAVRTACKTAKGWVRVVSINDEYALEFYLWDSIPDGVLISACTVTGPHVGTIDLCCYGSTNEYYPWYGVAWLGGTAPIQGDAYTFAVEYADGEGGSATATVRATLVDAPVSLSPADCEVVSTTTPTFSWTAPPCGCQGYYRIWVVDNDGTTMWSEYLSRETTSVVYPSDGYGAPLQPGGVYEWRLIAFDEPTSGGPDNNVWVVTRFGVQPAPTLELTWPNGGEELIAGQTYPITWNHTDATGKAIDIYLLKQVTGPDTALVHLGEAPAEDGSFEWTICPWIGDGNGYRVGIEFYEQGCPYIGDDSDGPFTITGSQPAPTLELLSPNGGEEWTAGQTYPITWASSNGVGVQVCLGLYDANGEYVAHIGCAPATDEVFQWAVCPYLAPGAYIVGICVEAEGQGCPEVCDESDAPFAITGSGSLPTLTLTSPNGGEEWIAGQTYPITWASSNGVGVQVCLGLYGANGEYVAHIGCTPATDEVFQWAVCPYLAPGAYIVGICVEAQGQGCPDVCDESDAPFAITGSGSLPTLTLTSPNGGEEWTAGQTYAICWVATNAEGTTINLDLHKVTGEHVAHLGEARAEDECFEWTVCPYIGDAADYEIQIGIYEQGCPAITDRSDAPFAITGSQPAPTLELLSPNGGESWPGGSEQLITWQTDAREGWVCADLRRGGETVFWLWCGPAADGEFSWSVGPPDLDAGSEYTIRVFFYSEMEGCPDLNVSDESDGPFEITQSSISGLVTSTQAPLAGILVELRGLPDQGGEYPAAYAVTQADGRYTQADGRYTLIGVPPGDYRLRAGDDPEEWVFGPAVQDPATGHWYERVDWPFGFDNAERFCESRGGYLAAVSSQAENDFIWNELREWYGGALGGTDRQVEGTWVWANGEPFSYTNWMEGQPDDYGAGEDYLELTGPDRQWNDLPFFGRFICEYEAPPEPAANYARTYYPDTPYSNEGQVVPVQASEHLADMDFVLSPGSEITGHVYDSMSGMPIEGAGLYVWASQWWSDAGFHTRSAADGSYHIRYLYLGSFQMWAEADGCVGKCYPNQHPWEGCQDVILDFPQTLAGVDYALDPGGSISGQVQIDRAAVEGLLVAAHGNSLVGWGYDGTDSNGAYTISSLLGDDYTVIVWSPHIAPDGTEYGPEVYNNKLTWDSADLVPLPDQGHVSGIDFTLDPAGRIEGTIYDEDTLERLSGAQLCFEVWDGVESHGTPFCFGTNYRGEYSAILKPATYLVWVYRPGYVGEYYGGVFDPQDATPVPVVAGQVAAGQDVYLNRAYNISGTVVDDETSAPLPGVSLFAFPVPPVTGLGSGDVADENGNFVIEGLPDGDYELRAAATGYCQELPVPITIDGADVTGVQVGLSPAPLGDFDADCDVDLDDYAGFAHCLAGPGVSPSPAPPLTANECLNAFDFEGDGDVDLRDFAGFQAAFAGVDQGFILVAAPANEGSLWRTAGNTIRFTFNKDITAPVAGQIVIQELLDGGGFASDLSVDFSFTVENDAGGNPRILRIRENGSVLTHRTWIAIRNVETPKRRNAETEESKSQKVETSKSGGWAGVAPFEIQYVVMIGDCNEDKKVTAADLSRIFPKIPTANAGDQERADVNGDGKVLASDLSAVFPHIPSATPPKPTGH